MLPETEVCDGDRLAAPVQYNVTQLQISVNYIFFVEAFNYFDDVVKYHQRFSLTQFLLPNDMMLKIYEILSLSRKVMRSNTVKNQNNPADPPSGVHQLVLRPSLFFLRRRVYERCMLLYDPGLALQQAQQGVLGVQQHLPLPLILGLLAANP